MHPDESSGRDINKFTSCIGLAVNLGPQEKGLKHFRREGPDGPQDPAGLSS
jgi:hypothetical protein